jgi:hypothetical protein
MGGWVGGGAVSDEWVGGGLITDLDMRYGYKGGV